MQPQPTIKDNLLKIQQLADDATAKSLPFVEKVVDYTVSKIMDIVTGVLLPGLGSKSLLRRVIARQVLIRIGAGIDALGLHSHKQVS